MICDWWLYFFVYNDKLTSKLELKKVKNTFYILRFPWCCNVLFINSFNMSISWKLFFQIVLQKFILHSFYIDFRNNWF
jgi:hypothetical protein